MSIPAGTRFGPYEIASRLGAGGMGEVYLARDTRLGRPVALKVLSAEFTANRDRLARFKKEARATSALNHPNIVTIHEIGSADSINYIVTEFIEGMTVRKRVARGRVRWTEAVDVAIQIATALSAAHSHGIVHRDIKPENVMLRTDGYVKVLDFGLAKLIEPSGQHEAGPEDSTVTNVNTDAGTIVGTVAYMSPEQLRQQELDGQTDIWSLGVVVYEMITGCAPFYQPTRSDLIVSILDREPLPLTHFVPDVPGELERIVFRALRKDREERYRKANELLEDLKKLRQQSDSESKPPRSLHSAPASGAAVSTDPGPTAVDTDERDSPTEPVRPARPTISVEYIISEIKRGGVGPLVVIVGLLTALIGGFFLARALISRHPGPLHGIELVEIVKTGWIREAAISPDGNYVAVLLLEGGQYGVSIRQVADSTLVPIVPLTTDRCRGLVFSRDGTNVFYLKQEGGGWDVFRVAALGGSSRKLITNVSSPVSLSPDGTQLAFLRGTEQGPALFVATAAGEAQRELAKASPHSFGVMRDLNNGPAWSPDGRVIACPVDNQGEPSHMSIALVTPTDGSVSVINSQIFYLIGQLAWLADGSGLVLNAVDSAKPSATFQLWFLSYPSGEARRITTDLNYYIGVSVSASDNLLSINRKAVTSIWLSEKGEVSRATPIANSQDRGSGGIAWLPDGSLIYSVNGPGNENIWVMEANGSNARQLTFGENADVLPVISRDGRYIIFTSFRTGEGHIWGMNVDGSGQRQLTFGKSEDGPQIAPDGQWITYTQLDAEKDSIWRMPMDGGAPVKLIDQEAKQPVVSPDGKQIACFSRSGSGNAPWQIAILPSDGGKPLRTFPAPASTFQQPQGMKWTPDGQSLAYIVTKADVANIWSQPLSGGEPRPLTDFKDSRIVAFDWSVDGNKMACVRSVEIHELILVRNFKPQ